MRSETLLNHLGKLIFNWISRRCQARAFHRMLKQRRDPDWKSHWRGSDLDQVQQVCMGIAREMGHPNYFYYPDDPLAAVFFNHTTDMREITAMRQAEDKTGRNLKEIEQMLVRDLFSE